MDIDGISFEGMNEADVREEFVTPLLRRLGYRSGFKHNIVREQSLRYPRSSLGRKKRSDPMLRGKADYICEANGRIRWVIEAKAPSESLGIDEAEQAYTYARHPEVRAVYFCLTNGHEFVVYRTDESPDAGPVLTVDYDDFPAGFSRIESLLSPAAVVRDHPEIEIDIGLPIGPSLRSVAQIVSGRVTIQSVTPNLTPLMGLNHSITEGAIERVEDESLVIYLDLLAPFQGLQDFSRRFGLDRMELASADSVLSADQGAPTVFLASQEMIIPVGERVLDLQSWTHIVSPIQLAGRADTRAEVVIEGHRLHGAWSQTVAFPVAGTEVRVQGDFDAQVF